jgi:hypothetical protein
VKRNSQPHVHNPDLRTTAMLLLKLRAGSAKLRQVLRECRTSPRKQYDYALEICWRDERGRIIHAEAGCVD